MFPQHIVREGIRPDEHFLSPLGAVIAFDKIYRQLTIRRQTSGAEAKRSNYRMSHDALILKLSKKTYRQRRKRNMFFLPRYFVLLVKKKTQWPRY